MKEGTKCVQRRSTAACNNNDRDCRKSVRSLDLLILSVVRGNTLVLKLRLQIQIYREMQLFLSTIDCTPQQCCHHSFFTVKCSCFSMSSGNFTLFYIKLHAKMLHAKIVNTFSN